MPSTLPKDPTLQLCNQDHKTCLIWVYTSFLCNCDDFRKLSLVTPFFCRKTNQCVFDINQIISSYYVFPCLVLIALEVVIYISGSLSETSIHRSIIRDIEHTCTMHKFSKLNDIETLDIRKMLNIFPS